MTTREIPRERWKEFFEGFSRRHEGWLVDVETRGAGSARPDARQAPLDGIAESDDGDGIEIRFGAPGGVHEIRSPRRIQVEEDRGAERALQIRSASGERTRVSFRSALPPEMVDGILPQ